MSIAISVIVLSLMYSFVIGIFTGLGRGATVAWNTKFVMFAWLLVFIPTASVFHAVGTWTGLDGARAFVFGALAIMSMAYCMMMLGRRSATHLRLRLTYHLY